MTDYTELKRLAKAAIIARNEYDADECNAELADEQTAADDAFHDAAGPDEVLALISENESLKGPHDWLAEDLIKELVDNAQAIQENADDGEEDPFVIVLLASASRIRRQEANIDKLRAENEQLAQTADCWDRLNIQNKALSDSFRAERDQLKAENEALRRERVGKVLCDLELFETLRDAANTEADEHRQCMATYRPLRQASLDSVVKKCDDLLATVGQKAPAAEIIWCACGDGHAANSYGAGFMDANGGVCGNCDAAMGGGERS